MWHWVTCPALSLLQELTNSCILEVVCTWGTDNENWAAAVHTCPAAKLAPDTALHHGWPDLWPQGVREGPWDGESLMTNHRAVPRMARSWTLPLKPGSVHSLSPGTPFPSPGKAGGELMVPAAPGRPLHGLPAAARAGCSPATARCSTGALRAVLESLQLVCCLLLVRALLFRHLHPTSQGHHACLAEVHVLHTNYLHPQCLCAACWDAHWPWAGWQLQPLGKGMQG